MEQKIGIDFGTTNCAIGRVTADDRITTQGPIPSTMAWRNGEYFFGGEALELLASDEPGIHPIREVKLGLGRHDIRIGRDQISSVEASSQLLQFVCERVGGAENVAQCVMATPITSDIDQRQALRAASQAAGIHDMRIVYEPTAALIGAEGDFILSGRHTVLVVDWGGGTLDLSIIQAHDGAFRELAVGGDHFTLGGGKIDEEITKLMLRRHQDVGEHIDRTDGAFERLRFEVEREKIDSVDDPDGEHASEQLITLSWLGNAVLEMKPLEVFGVFREFSDRAVRLIEELLESNNISKRDITHVAFAGGTSNCAVVRDVIMDNFTEAKTILSPNSQLLTGEGCTHLVARKFVVELSRSFGFRQVDQSICVLLPAGHPIEQDTYRQVELLVVDTEATEAVIECGLMAAGAGREELVLQGGAGFKPLDSLYIPCGSVGLTNTGAERIVLFSGVDRDLAVTLYAKARKSGNSEMRHLTGLPLIIRYSDS